MSKMLVDKSVPDAVKKMHSKSIKAGRIYFMKSFEDNLNRIQDKNGKKLVKINKNHISYERKDGVGHVTKINKIIEA
jgi:3-methyladenine DNA glycosylase AlkC